MQFLLSDKTRNHIAKKGVLDMSKRKCALMETANATTPGTDTNDYRQFRENKSEVMKKTKLYFDYESRDSYFKINLGTYYGVLPRACKPFIDNDIIERLDHIQQLGVCSKVFPNANHTRKIHSLGTAHLACELCLELQKQKVKGKPPMTSQEILCVVIAAICHDSGHGPYSHLCEELLVQKDGTKITHEQMSVLLFEKKILEEHAKPKSDKYLTEGHYKLIKQLIDPPPFFDSDGNWNKDLAVPPEKAFLFFIVNNPISGLDVDKMDYLFRDSQAGVEGVTMTDIKNCFSQVQIQDSPCKKYKCLSYPLNKPEIVSVFFERRPDLHKKVYQNKAVFAIALMLQRAIKLVLKDLKLSKGEKKNIPLEECFYVENLDMYMELRDDSLLDQIKNSTSESANIKEAQKILNNIVNRKLCRTILAFERLEANTDYSFLSKEKILEELKKCELSKSFNKDELFVEKKEFHAGKGLFENPMNKIFFYTPNGETQYQSFPEPQYESKIFIVGPHNCNEKDFNILYKAMEKYAAQHGCQSKLVQLFKKSNIENIS